VEGETTHPYKIRESHLLTVGFASLACSSAACSVQYQAGNEHVSEMAASQVLAAIEETSKILCPPAHL
jgi:hypothetical protein